MVAMYYGKIENDDAYNKVREQFGDDFDAAAQSPQVNGLEARFITNGTTDAVRKLLSKGQPVPVGWLHKGPSSKPSGGGHWSVLIGYRTGTWIVNDPNGEAALAEGYPIKMALTNSTATRTSTHVGLSEVKVTVGILTYVITKK